MRRETTPQQKTTDAPAAAQPKAPRQVSPPRRALVFISHDSRDAELAEAFANLLTDASGGMLASFRSSDRKGTAGLDFGAEWYNAIMEKLGDATDVVALLTESSMDRPWILYEAGVAKGKIDTTVLGVLIGVPENKANIGPFAQFQNCGDGEESLTKLVLQLIKRNPEASPREEAVRRCVSGFREQIQVLLKKRPEAAKREAQPRADEAGIAKLFEEVKVMLRELPDTIRGRRRFHPMRMEEVLMMARHGMGERFDRASAWLMFISTFRDQCPWLYELGTDVYRALRAGDPEAARLGMGRIQDMTEVAMHGPWGEEMLGDRDMLMMVRHMPDILDRFLSEPEERAARPRAGRTRGEAHAEE